MFASDVRMASKFHKERSMVSARKVVAGAAGYDLPHTAFASSDSFTLRRRRQRSTST